MQWIVVALFFVVRTAEVDVLVEGLHDPDFSVREAAAAKIERMGRWAVLGLERGLQHRDPEVRHRCARLLELARRSDREVGLAALLEDPDRAEAKRLPGWERFRKRYGQELDARELFVAMMRAEPNLSPALDGNEDGLLAVYRTACAKVHGFAHGRFEGKAVFHAPLAPHGDVPGLLGLVMFISVEYPRRAEAADTFPGPGDSGRTDGRGGDGCLRGANVE